MSVQEKIEAVRAKLNNGDLNLDIEEKEIIINNEELALLLISVVNKIDTYDKDEEITSIIDSIIEGGNCILEGKGREEAILLLIKLYIRQGSYDPNLAEEATAAFGYDMDDSDFYERISKIVYEELANPNNKLEKASVSDDLIEKLIELRRFDILQDLEYSEETVSDEVMQKALEVCPDKNAWKLVKTYRAYNYDYEFSVNDSFEFLFEAYKHYISKSEITEKDRMMIENIRNVAKEKIKQADDLSNLSSRLLDDMYDTVSYDESMLSIGDLETSKMLSDKGCMYVTASLYRIDAISFEEAEEKLHEAMKKKTKIPSDVFELLKINIFKNEEYINYLIEQGELEFILSQCIGKEDTRLKKYIPKIVENIENNPNYSKYLTNISYEIALFPELMKAILKQGKVTNLCLRLDSTYDDELYDLIVKNAKERALFVDLQGSIENNTKLGEVLLKNDCFSTLYMCSSLPYLMGDRELIISKLDNVYFAKKMVVDNLSLLSDDKEIVRILLSNPLLIDSALEKIAHDEKLTEELCTDENYELVKEHLIKKYNFNREHLDKMEKQLGSKIMIYAGNENIQHILALPDEEFDKVMALFPKVDYTMIDVEASYESLVQFSFGKERVEDISIFPLLVHAIEDGDIDKIKKLREKLVINTRIDFLNKLITKHNLSNIQNTGELIDFIISKCDGEEKEKYINILHELTDEYIANARIEYRNNHYYDKEYPTQYNKIELLFKAIEDGEEVLIKQLEYAFANALNPNTNIVYPLGYPMPTDLEPSALVEYVVKRVRDPKTRDAFLPVLKQIADCHYEMIKNEHSKEICIGEELGLDYKLEEKSKRNAIVKYLIINSHRYVDEDGYFIKEKIIRELFDQGFTPELIDDCFSYYSGKKEYVHNPTLVQEKLGIFVQVANRIVRNGTVLEFGRTPINEKEIAKVMDNQREIKRIYCITNKDYNPYLILANLNIDLLRENLLSKEEDYKKAVELMEKKKIHLLPHNFEGMLETCEISPDISNVAAFLNFFPTILENERKKLSAAGKDPNMALSGLASIMVNADTYSSVSSVFAQILGDKDAKLVKANPGPNEAREKTKNNQRLIEATDYTANNFQRTEVTVPAFDEVITIDTGNGPKRIEVIVGNFTDGSNITHGERTGACMRIGGVGESLFRFCLTNKNGFHIRFEDPETHEYISRVSGFRNGNTVFLNELRHSCLPKYSDADLVAACTEVARMLIEKSKDSSCPIENVVIHKDYAMMSSDENPIYLGIPNNKVGLPKFYSDIGSSGVVLATSAKDKPFAPIDFDKSKVPTYETCRSRVSVSLNPNELLGKINRVGAVKLLLAGTPLGEIDSMEFPDGILCGMYSDDWYIYVDEKKGIHYDYIDVDKRAKKEVTRHLELVDGLIKRAEQENEMRGDVSYGTK